MDTLKIRFHLFGALVATLCMAAFFITTIAVELMGNPEAIATLKGFIVVPGLFILIPALGLAGSSGFSLAKRRKGRLLKAKQRRMPFIVANGSLVLRQCNNYGFSVPVAFRSKAQCAGNGCSLVKCCNAAAGRALP